MLYISILNDVISVTYLLLKLCMMLLGSYILIRSMLNRKIRGFLSDVHTDNEGNVSWLRWVSSTVIISALVLVFIQTGTEGGVDVSLVLGMLGIGVTGKVGQKFAEKKTENKIDI